VVQDAPQEPWSGDNGITQN